MKKLCYCLFILTTIFFLLLTSINTVSAANWWDKFGTPKYGGTITLAVAQTGTNWDVLTFGGGGYFFEAMFFSEWTLDRNVWAFDSFFIPDQYQAGNLAEGWEINDPQTITVKIRKGIKWQDKPPVNGRELTAHDVEAHYTRVFKESPMFAGMLRDWDGVEATDDYTVVYKFKKPSGQWLQGIADRGPWNTIEAPEWAAMDEAARNKWENTVGTGPFMLTGFVKESSYTYTKNPNYWRHDERHPENQIPYIDKLVTLVILDSATRTAALRTGKIDYLGVSMTSLNWQQAAALAKSNPELVQGKISNGSSGMTFRLDKKPFDDIRVRKAFNMAIDRKTIAKSIYGGNATGEPCGIISPTLKGYAFAYKDWPESLKDEYAYNPEKAKQLLADAGYPNGFKTNIVSANTQGIELMEAIKAQLQDIGVDMEIKLMDFPSWEAFRRAGKHDQLIGAGAAFTWPINRVVEQFYSKGPDHGDSMVNDPGYDALRDKFFSALDTAEAQRICQEFDRYIIEKHWQTTAGENFVFNVWQPYLKGYSGEFLFIDAHQTLSRIWIDKK